MHEQLGKFVVAREHSPIWLPACPTWMVTTSRGIANARCVLAAVLVVRALCVVGAAAAHFLPTARACRLHNVNSLVVLEWDQSSERCCWNNTRYSYSIYW